MVWSNQATLARPRKNCFAMARGVKRSAQHAGLPDVASESEDDEEQQLPTEEAATIRFSTGAATSPPAHWVTQRAATDDTMYLLDAMRLAGSSTLTFAWRGAPAKSKALLAKLGAPVDVVPTQPVNPRAGVRTFDKKGEPASAGGTIPVHRLLAALKAGQMEAVEPHAEAWLTAVNALITPDGPWKCPCARCLIRGPTGSTLPPQLVLTFHVYFGRLAFELIACEHIAVVMKHLQPCKPIVSPVRPLPSYPQTLFSEAVPEDDDPFTAESLLRGMEHTGYREAQQPAGVVTPLYGYQRQALAWMLDQEGRPGGLNAAFWETRAWADSSNGSSSSEPDLYYYFPLAGELRLAAPPSTTGGMLVLQMGLGKTLCVTSLIVADMPAAKHAARQSSSTKSRSAGTLVVMPTTLLAQWRREIEKSTAPGALRVTVYAPDHAGEASQLDHGGRGAPAAGASCNDDGGAILTQLAAHDIVLTSYRTLEQEASGRGGAKVLTRIHWRRIALDECQEVRSNTTALAKTAASLQCDHRWLISGTPMHTGVDDINGELMFLSVWPFALANSKDGFWNHKITQPLRMRLPAVLPLLRALLSGVALRHSKTQRDVNGLPLAGLPPLMHALRPVQLSGSDAYCVKFLESYTARVLSIAADLGFLNQPPRKRNGESIDAFQARATAYQASRAARVRAGQVTQSLLTLIRDSCTAVGLPHVTPPLGSSDTAVAAARRADDKAFKAFLRDVDRLIRAALQGVFDVTSVGSGGGNGGGDGGGPSGGASGGGILSVPAMTAEQALQLLMRRATNSGNARDQQAGLVRHGEGAAVGGAAYDTNRTYATQPLGMRLSDALHQLTQAEAKRAAACSELARMRWHLAVATAKPQLLKQPMGLVLVRRTNKEIKAKATALKQALMAAKSTAGGGNAGSSSRPARTPANAAAGIAAHRDALDAAVNEAIKRSKTEADTLCARRNECTQDAVSKAAFVSLLQRAVSAVGEHADVPSITQSGYQCVQNLAQGLPGPPCCICTTQPAVNPVVTPCVHISCGECTLAWLHARQGRGTCPLCRKPFSLADLIRIIPAEKPAAAAAAGPSSASMALALPAAQMSTVPSFCPAATEEDVAALAATPDIASVPLMRANGSFPSIPAIFLTHAARARAGCSPKLAALMEDVLSILSTDGNSKVVVFSQSPASVTHVTCAMRDQGVGCVRIQVSMPEPERAQAIRQFNDDPATRVFVLHVGTAAAGLTLTCANHVLLLEPFLCDSDEAQAINRCHRIGQTRPVHVKQYYMRNTVEERLLAFRLQERSEDAADTALAHLGSSDSRSAESGKKMMFCFGLQPTTAQEEEEEEEEHSNDDEEDSD